jgi:hypothetical protein
MVLGYAAFLYGLFGDLKLSYGDFTQLGGSTIICSLLWFFVARGRHVEEQVYEAGRQAGYDAGYLDGRRISKPVVVALRATGS